MNRHRRFTAGSGAWRSGRPGVLAVYGALLCAACTLPDPEPELPRGVLTAGFVALEGVYNSELMAPYDILHHSVFRDSLNYVEPFVVAATMEPLTTFEGIQITPHYSFENVPPIDILVIPSTSGSMDRDLDNKEFMDWLQRVIPQSRYVITVCDGAFPLAATGALDGREATTFPADRELFASMFSKVDVAYDVNFAVDDRFITSVGGALSYEPALYLLERLYGKAHARETATGLVLDWNLSRTAHRVVRSAD